MTRQPDFDELVGTDLPVEERERLLRAHELLVAAGPPPELPPALVSPPELRASVSLLPRRRRGALLLLAAAVAAATFGIGFLVGHRGGGFSATRTVPMHGTAAAPRARASLVIGHRDGAGNWPMKMTVRGLAQLPPGQYYELYLTRGGLPVAPCGTFVIHGGATTVRLNAPYQLSRFDGWVVTRNVRGQRQDQVLLTT